MKRNVNVDVLSYKQNIYKFLYNLSCQVFKTFMFLVVAPIIRYENLCILFYKNFDVTYYKAYRAISPIVNNNTSNFLERYGVKFDQHFKKKVKLLEDKVIAEKFFIFEVNKCIILDCKNTFRCESGGKVKYEDVIYPEDVPV